MAAEIAGVDRTATLSRKDESLLIYGTVALQDLADWFQDLDVADAVPLGSPDAFTLMCGALAADMDVSLVEVEVFPSELSDLTKPGPR